MEGVGEEEEGELQNTKKKRKKDLENEKSILGEIKIFFISLRDFLWGSIKWRNNL